MSVNIDSKMFILHSQMNSLLLDLFTLCSLALQIKFYSLFGEIFNFVHVGRYEFDGKCEVNLISDACHVPHMYLQIDVTCVCASSSHLILYTSRT